jgi:hypothetical protein
MRFSKKIASLATILTFLILSPATAFAATSATLSGADSYSVIGDSVTCTGASTVNFNVGASPGSSITGFPVPCVDGPPGVTHSADASAAAAQADNTAAFTFINQGCDVTYGGVQDLTLVSPLVAGTYCSTGSFILTGNLTLSGTGVWIFKSASTIVTSPGSSVTGGNACNIWWRAVSSVTLDTTTSFRGNVLALASITMNNGATLNGRLMAQTAAVTLDNNVITTSSCIAAPTPTPTGIPGLPQTDLSTPEGNNSGLAIVVAIAAVSSGAYLIQKRYKVSI